MGYNKANLNYWVNTLEENKNTLVNEVENFINNLNEEDKNHYNLDRLNYSLSNVREAQQNSFKYFQEVMEHGEES